MSSWRYCPPGTSSVRSSYCRWRSGYGVCTRSCAGKRQALPAQTVNVTLWRELPLPPVQRIEGARPAVVIDVVIETEYDVWGLTAATARGT